MFIIYNRNNDNSFLLFHYDWKIYLVTLIIVKIKNMSDSNLLILGISAAYLLYNREYEKYVIKTFQWNKKIILKHETY
jgi:hypothetical protein